MSYLGCYPDNLITDHPASPEFRPGRECAVTSKANSLRAECHDHAVDISSVAARICDRFSLFEHQCPAGDPSKFLGILRDLEAIDEHSAHIMGDGRAA